METTEQFTTKVISVLSNNIEIHDGRLRDA
jgi:hypothetical protein